MQATERGEIINDVENKVIQDPCAVLKLPLAVRHPGDREAYTLGKMEFVENVLRTQTGKDEAARW